MMYSGLVLGSLFSCWGILFSGMCMVLLMWSVVYLLCLWMLISVVLGGRLVMFILGILFMF